MLVLIVVVLLMCSLLLSWDHLHLYHVSVLSAVSTLFNAPASERDEDIFLTGEVVLHARLREEASSLNGRLINEADASQDELVGMLSSLLSLSDHAFFTHCERTAAHVRGFAEHLGLSAQAKAQLNDAARLHLLGLLGAPRGLLSRLERGLNMEEQAIWEFHAILGAQKLELIEGLRSIAQIIKAYMTATPDQHDVEDEFGACERVTPEAFYHGLILKICSLYELELSRQLTRQDRSCVAVAYALQRLRLDDSLQTSLELLDIFGEYVMASVELARPERELRSIDELTVGMVLSRPIRTSAGLPMFDGDVCVCAEVLARLSFFEELSQERFTSIFVWS